jgi:hypothetical protein
MALVSVLAAPRAGRHDVVTRSSQRGLRPIPDSELGVQATNVRLHRVDREEQLRPISGLLIPERSREHFLFSREGFRRDVPPAMNVVQADSFAGSDSFDEIDQRGSFLRLQRTLDTPASPASSKNW